ncbi:MAG: dienelactone hydrolase family protein, partial [Myxococcota bacterium]
IRGMTEQLAKRGYVALAVDLYGKEPATTSDAATAMMKEAMGQSDVLVENLGQASAFLAERSSGKRGVIGWCFGGAWSLQASLAMPEALDAVVVYYGRLITDEAKLSALDDPLLGIFGAQDEGIPVESVRTFEATLEKLGKDATIHVYDGASHAFANPSGSAYNQQAAEDAWAKTTAFLDTHLKGD